MTLRPPRRARQPLRDLQRHLRLLAAADVERREGRALPQLDLALAHQLQAGGERAGARRAPHLRLHEIFDEVGIERRPVRRRADQPHQALARLLQREHLALADLDASRRPCAGGARHRPTGGRRASRPRPTRVRTEMRLRHAARKDVEAEARTAHQPAARLAHRLQMAQPRGEHGGELLAARLASSSSSGSSSRDFR